MHPAIRIMQSATGVVKHASTLTSTFHVFYGDDPELIARRRITRPVNPSEANGGAQVIWHSLDATEAIRLRAEGVPADSIVIRPESLAGLDSPSDREQ